MWQPFLFKLMIPTQSYSSLIHYQKTTPSSFVSSWDQSLPPKPYLILGLPIPNLFLVISLLVKRYQVLLLGHVRLLKKVTLKLPWQFIKLDQNLGLLTLLLRITWRSMHVSCGSLSHALTVSVKLLVVLTLK